MRPSLLLLPFLLLSLPAHACDGGPLFSMLDAASSTPPDATLDVAEIQSTEGGEWKVWLAPDGAARELARIDYGEGGRAHARLIVSSPAGIAVTLTSYTYSAPHDVAGSMVVREEKDIYVWCDGALHLPREDSWLDPAYAQNAADALAIFTAPEVAQWAAPLIPPP